jgi:hypothetical protein
MLFLTYIPWCRLFCVQSLNGPPLYRIKAIARVLRATYIPWNVSASHPLLEFCFKHGCDRCGYHVDLSSGSACGPYDDMSKCGATPEMCVCCRIFGMPAVSVPLAFDPGLSSEVTLPEMEIPANAAVLVSLQGQEIAPEFQKWCHQSKFNASGINFLENSRSSYSAD